MMFPKHKQRYDPIQKPYHDNEEDVLSLPDGHIAQRRVSGLCGHINRICTWSVLIVIGFLAGYFTSRLEAHPLGTYENGFMTENAILPSSVIALERRKFSGGVEFVNGQGQLITQPGEQQFVGDPSPAIDEAWDTMLVPHYFSISESEAKALWGDGYERYRDQINGGFTGGFDMWHSLHCLNQFRKSLNRSYYPEEHLHGVTHQCTSFYPLPYRSKVLQCYSDGTITPSLWSPGLQGQYVDSAQHHTCRNFERMRDYTLSRYNGSEAHPRPAL